MRRQDPSYSLNLIECVEKYPCLYDFNLGEYSVRDITNAAWERVAAEMKDSAANCRKYWRHLRIVFGRNLKKDPYNQNHCTVTKSIIQEKMKFLIPFMKINDTENVSIQRHSLPVNLKEEPDDLSSPISTLIGDNSLDYHDNNDIDKTIAAQRLNEDVTQTINSDEQRLWLSNVNRNEEFSNHNSYKDNIEPEKKKRKFENSHNNNIYYKNSISNEHQENYRKHYLISLLPDVEEMNSQQFRLFRKKVDEIIAEIL
ncbi:hypothetical protein O3M35_009820 [Rhynocoris fuscipes]|uniref:MADF domain-containing protein n=1 Tax=Rhynocoris fuscipes TaxID=488301 RepID=A0AAW1D5T2_9HEMI